MALFAVCHRTHAVSVHWREHYLISRETVEVEKDLIYKVLRSGDAIALEIIKTISEHVFTSDL